MVANHFGTVITVQTATYRNISSLTILTRIANVRRKCIPEHQLRNIKTFRRFHLGGASFGSPCVLYYTLFFISNAFFRLRLKCCLAKSKIHPKLALPYLTRRCLKYNLGREQSFHKGSVLNIFRDRF